MNKKDTCPEIYNRKYVKYLTHCLITSADTNKKRGAF